MRIHYEAAVAAEAAKFQGYVQGCHEGLKAEFPDLDLDAEMNDPIGCTLYLVPSRIERAGPGHASSRTSIGGGKPPLCELYLMPASRLAPGEKCCTKAQEPFDEDSDHRVACHEYSGVVLRRLNYRYATWELHTAPGWFVQGYEEYLSVMHSGAHGREITFSKYRTLVKADPSRVSASGVANDYIDGAVLHQFLRAEFGPTKPAKILLSKKASFESAVESELGVTTTAMSTRWQTWRRTRLRE